MRGTGEKEPKQSAITAISAKSRRTTGRRGWQVRVTNCQHNLHPLRRGGSRRNQWHDLSPLSFTRRLIRVPAVTRSRSMVTPRAASAGSIRRRALPSATDDWGKFIARAASPAIDPCPQLLCCTQPRFLRPPL